MRTMRRTIIILVLLAMSVGGAFAQATDSDTHVVTIAIGELAAIAVVGGNITMPVPAITAGSTIVGATSTDSTTADLAYTVLNPDALGTIEASIDVNTPAGYSLGVTVAAPGIGTVAPIAALTTTPTNLITGLSSSFEAALDLTYTLTIDTTNPATTSAPYTVTFTINS